MSATGQPGTGAHRQPPQAVLVTGGASGIGLALAQRAAHNGARVAIADLDAAAADAAAARLPGGPHLGLHLDVTDEQTVAAAVMRIEAVLGPLSTAFSNAGVNRGRDLADPQDWTLALDVHVHAHVHLARHLIPRMLARGGGEFIVTSSAAGLLTNIESAPYTVSKHAAVAFAEWLAIRYGDEGLHVACICPQGVRTAMTAGREDAATGSNTLIDPGEVAEAAFAALAQGEFLVLPHPEVAGYEQRRASDRDRWLAGMRRIRSRTTSAATPATPTAKEQR